MLEVCENWLFGLVLIRLRIEHINLHMVKTFPSARLISERPTNDSLQVYLCTVYDVIVPRSGDWNLLGVKILTKY